MVAFDLLYLNGYDLRKLPLIERKALLKKIIAETDVQFSESFDVDGREMFKHACKTGLEGVVSKVRDSRYRAARLDRAKSLPPVRSNEPLSASAVHKLARGRTRRNLKVTPALEQRLPEIDPAQL